MNILDAMRSGRRFRRPSWEIYYSDTHEGFLELTPEDLLAEDWVIEEKKVTITASEFTAAWANAVKEAMISTSPDYERIIYQQLKQELGL